MYINNVSLLFQREVKVVKKQVTKENKVEEHNGDHNGDANGDTEMTVKLPTKKSGAKTETKVEVERKVLPDGSVEEVKTTTTKTTIDGRTEIKTRTETTIIPKEEESEEEVVEEEEEQETEKQQEVNEEPETVTVTQTVSAPKENGDVIKSEEKSETTVAKKIVVVQEVSPAEQSEEVEEEEEEVEEDVVESEPVTVVLKKPSTPVPETESKTVEEEVEEDEEDVEEEPEQVKQEVVREEIKQQPEEEEVEEEEIQATTESKEEVKESHVKDEEEEQEEEEEFEEAEEKQEAEVKTEEKTEIKDTEKKEEEVVEEKVKEDVVKEEETAAPVEESKEPPKEEEHVIPIQIQTTEEPKPKEKSTEFTIPIREPSIPLDKVEDVEIKPIGISPIITKTHTENTEIITSTIDPAGGVSKQTEYNKIENIVTVNRTTKILDHNYENLTQQGIPTVKTYFPPPSIDRITSSPMPSRPYQPVYPPEPIPERRHSLLLERLSTERQMPSDIYQNQYNQTYDQSQYQPEPQSEVLTVSNVKPSTITNQQWYQQTKQTQNVLYNNVTSNPAPVGAPWAQPKSPQPQQQYQPAPQPQYQAQYQPPVQPQFQRGTTPQPAFQRGTTPQPQYQKAATPQTQYQPSYTEPIRDRTPTNNYSTYTPTPTWVASAVDTTPTPYSYINKDTTQSYQKNTHSSTTQQYSSGYVPPPWEQDSSYSTATNTVEKYYQEVPQTNTYSPAASQGWKPTAPSNKFTKPAPIAYVPPAPNQSFVKAASNVEPPRQPGRKTYYSEYERRYITVPESTYIPTETKFQPQPDPSPQYYYDNNEPQETVEPQWRKELREFTEKTSHSQITETTNVQPPWEQDSKYAKTPSSTYTPTPTWSQTLRPQSYRERSFESEYVSQEWPKTNTLGRGRPLSTMGKSVDGVGERARGVSVDRYNPNSYQPPAEHPPVQSHTLTTPVPHASYHNPNVPAYHARASAEPRYVKHLPLPNY